MTPKFQAAMRQARKALQVAETTELPQAVWTNLIKELIRTAPPPIPPGHLLLDPSGAQMFRALMSIHAYPENEMEQ